MPWGEQVLKDEGGRWSSGEIVWNTGGPHGVHRPAVFWKEVVKLRWWHACTWLQNITLGRCLSTTNISYAIIRCTVAPTVSPAWSQGMPGTYIIYKGIQGIPLLQCTSLVLISWVRMGYPCLRSTTRYYLLVHPLSNYVHPPIQLQQTDEHTDSSWHYILAGPPSSSPSTVYTTTSPNHILPPHLHSYTPSRSKTKS